VIIAELLLGALVALTVNEAAAAAVAVRLARWAARREHAIDPARAATRSDEYARDVGQEPRSPGKLALAGQFAAKALLVSAGRAVRRLSRGDRRPDVAVRCTWQRVHQVSEVLSRYDDVGRLTGRGRGEFRQLIGYLEALLRAAGLADAATAERLLQATTSAALVLIEDRDEPTAWRMLQAAEPLTGLFSGQHPAVLRLRMAGAHARLQLGHPAEAERRLADLVPVAVAVLGADHPVTLDGQRLMAWSALQQGRPEQAADGFAALRRRIDGVGAPIGLRLHVLCMQAWVTARTGHSRQAADLYATVVTSRERLLGPDHPHTLDTRESLARVLWERGEHQDARSELAAVLALRRQSLGRRHPDTLETRKVLLLWAPTGGGPARSRRRRRLRRIEAAQARVLGPAHPYPADTRHQLERS
jgi:hypothetical protein